jgi:hypothetical protein
MKCYYMPLTGMPKEYSTSIRYRVRDLAEAANFLTFLSNYDQDLKP